MKKTTVKETSSEGLPITIEHELGIDCYELTIGSNTSKIEVSKEELQILQSLLAEILENQ